MIMLSFLADHERKSENQTSNNTINTLKILYTPYTNLTLAVIKKANTTFETAAQILALADEVANCSRFFLDNFPPESLQGVSEVCM